MNNETKNADYSSMEIKTALRKLNPKNGGDHKYRVRRLNKFRNYVTGDKNTPEFYDDDLVTLFVGSNSSTMSGGDDLLGYSLLQAAGEPSTDHNGVLKRSAKHAMALVKFLVCDFKDIENGEEVQLTGDLNGFAHAFCCLPVSQLHQCKFELHLLDNHQDTKRAGSKEDACELILLLIMNHFNELGTEDDPISLEQLVPNATSRNSFFSWMKTHKSANAMEKMKKRLALANESNPNQNEIDLNQSFNDDPFASDPLGFNTENMDEDNNNINNSAIFKKIGASAANALSTNKTGPPTRWLDSEFADFTYSSSTQNDVTKVEAGDTNDTTISTKTGKKRENTREAHQAAAEKERNVEERKKNNGKDPLGLRGNDFDLRIVQAKKEVLVQEALELFQEEEEEEMQFIQSNRNKNNANNHAEGEKGGGDVVNSLLVQEKLLGLQSRRDSFMAMIEKSAAMKSKLQSKASNSNDPSNSEMKEEENLEQDPTNNNSIGSILPFDSDFDPMLFLTLVHGRATYDQLMEALKSLNNTADNQVSRLQKIVRDNFGLFVRCADGIDFFSDESETNENGDNEYSEGESKEKTITRALAPEQLDKVEGLADSCSSQAKKSFKPLLDNTNEVRKTQRALALLQRVSPLLQVPHQMRQHMETGNLNYAIKAYRRILVIDVDCEIDLLRFVKAKADEAAIETRSIVEKSLADASISVSSLLDAIRDLGELEELNVNGKKMEQALPSGSKKKKRKEEDKKTQAQNQILRQNPPALACLQLQASHFSSIVEYVIEHSESVTTRIYNGDSSALQDDYFFGPAALTSKSDQESIISDFSSNTSDSRRKNKWRYDILEARVKATVQGVAIARKWLNRLLRIGVVAMDVERRHAVRLGQRKTLDKDKKTIQPMEVFATLVTPAIKALVSHINFCSLGCSNTNKSSEAQVKMTFGESSPQALQILLRTPLPPHESSRCASELADLVKIVQECANTAQTLRPNNHEHTKKPNQNGLGSPDSSTKRDSQMEVDLQPLQECVKIAQDAVITIERRRCIYAFHVCTRNCGRRASGSGVFDGEALRECVHTLSDELSQPEECSIEVEKGCHLVVLKCCEGLEEYVKDKGGAVRLRAVSECATMLSSGIQNVVREVSSLTNGHAEHVLEVMENEILKLEEKLFKAFLEEVKKDVTSCIKLGYLDFVFADDDGEGEDDIVFDQKPVYSGKKNGAFPGYLSASLLAIVRCRGRVQKAIGESILRKSQNQTYLHIAMSTASDTLIDELCGAISERSERMSGKQADMMANELQFLVNTLNKDLSLNIKQSAEQCRRMLCSMAGRGRGIQGDGPDGLAAIEELERLGRVYVMCLGSDE